MPIYAVLEAIPPGAQGGEPGPLRQPLADVPAHRPSALPSGCLAGCTFAFVLSMGDFLAPQLLGGNDSALMVSNLVWSLFGVAYNWPLGAAVSVVVLLLTLFLLWLANRVRDGDELRRADGRAGGAGRRAARTAGGGSMPADERIRPTAVRQSARPTVRSDRLTALLWLAGAAGLRVHLSAADGGDPLRLPRSPIIAWPLRARAPSSGSER